MEAHGRAADRVGQELEADETVRSGGKRPVIRQRIKKTSPKRLSRYTNKPKLM